MLHLFHPCKAKMGLSFFIKLVTRRDSSPILVANTMGFRDLSRTLTPIGILRKLLSNVTQGGRAQTEIKTCITVPSCIQDISSTLSQGRYGTFLGVGHFIL